MRRNSIFIAAVAVAALFLGSGCSQKYSAESDGKNLGQAVCDLKKATTPEDATDAKGDIKEQLDDLAGKYSLFTAEDRKDIDENLADLAEHVVQGNAALINQDLAVLRRSAAHIAEDNFEISSAAWDGFREGLAGCEVS
jgi:hypothetical protein